MQQYLDLLLPHWPFLTASGVLYVVGRALKAGPLSPARAREIGWVRAVRRWFPLPLHPLVAGAMLGAIPGMPVSPGVEIWPVLGPILYYTGAGALSVLGHDIYREWQKHKGVSILPGE